jgi:hypothetical protein
MIYAGKVCVICLILGRDGRVQYDAQARSR